MRDLTNPKLIYAKGVLFLLIGVLSSILLIVPRWNWRDAVLLAAAVWGFCRAYYFAFYVIEHYVDREFRFAGLWSFVRYLMTRKRDTLP
jgi:hypothetical protein